ncbi:MAG: hypothetical protein ACYS74_04215 [Planctomycetota bacterium]
MKEKVDTEEQTSAENRSGENESQIDDGRPKTGGRSMRHRWQSFVIPGLTVICCLLLGYYLDAEVIKWFGIIFVVIWLLILC